MRNLVKILTLKLTFLVMQQTDIKNIPHIDASGFALKSNLASLKTKVNQLGTDKFMPVPVDLSNLSDAVKNDVVNKNCIS